jgi:hypothetical protein
MNWVFISQKTAFFIVTTIKTSNLTCDAYLGDRGQISEHYVGNCQVYTHCIENTTAFFSPVTMRVAGALRRLSPVSECRVRQL